MTLVGCLAVAVTALKRQSTAEVNRLAGFIFRTEQALAGLIRMFGFAIDKQENALAKADPLMFAVGTCNAFQAVLGYGALADPELESRLLYCVGDGVGALLIFALSRYSLSNQYDRLS